MFKKKKSKLDSKVRFQQNSFKKQLQNAREYKRTMRQLPESNTEIFFAKIGLNGWLKKLVTAAVILIIFYLLFIPNFLFITTLTVNGLDDNDTAAAQGLVHDYLEQKPLTLQKNIIFLSPYKLTQYLLSHSQKIQSVEFVHKVFPHTLIIKVQPRTAEYLVSDSADSSSYLIVSKDGRLQQQVFANTSTPDSFKNLTKINIETFQEFKEGDRVIESISTEKIQEIKNNFLHILQDPVDHFSLKTATSTDVTVVTQSGYKVYISTLLEIPKTIEQLSLLLQNLDPDQKKNLYYINMQFDQRAFVCLKNTACAVERAIIPEATSTFEQIYNPSMATTTQKNIH